MVQHAGKNLHTQTKNVRMSVFFLIRPALRINMFSGTGSVSSSMSLQATIFPPSNVPAAWYVLELALACKKSTRVSFTGRWNPNGWPLNWQKRCWSWELDGWFLKQIIFWNRSPLSYQWTLKLGSSFSLSLHTPSRSWIWGLLEDLNHEPWKNMFCRLFLHFITIQMYYLPNTNPHSDS